MTPSATRILMAGLLLLALLPLDKAAASRFQIIGIADLHSAIDHYPRLLASLHQLAADDPDTPRLILLNGDLFEAGDPLAARSGGKLDWQLLADLRNFGPVVFNIGNHDFDIVDPAELRKRADKLGILLIGNVALADGSAPAPAAVDISLGDSLLRIVGVTTDQQATWPAQWRHQLKLPEPVQWMAQHWPHLTADAELIVLASHAGLQADRRMQPLFATGPQPLLFFGAHDHLLLEDSLAGIPYVHAGSGGEQFALATVETGAGSKVEVSVRLMAAKGPEDVAMAAAVQQLRENMLTPAESERLGWVGETLSLPAAARWASTRLQEDPEVDAVFLNHTSFGAGLNAGPLSRYRFDRFLRFDNGLMQVQVDAATLRRIKARAQPQQDLPLAERSGDHLYGVWPEAVDGQHYRLLTSDWIAMPANQSRYLGETFAFEPLAGPTIKARLIEALQSLPDTR